MQKSVHLASKLSFDSAAQSVAATLELKLNAKRVERLTERIGRERVAQREQSIAQWQALSLVEKLAAPTGIKAPDVVVISTDGGRLVAVHGAGRSEGKGSWRRALVIASVTNSSTLRPCWRQVSRIVCRVSTKRLPAAL